MKHRLRTPAWQPPPPPPARPLGEDPSWQLVAMYQRIEETRMRGLPFLNTALQVEAVGFRRWHGDWIGALITPWFVNLFVLPGGGELWRDLPGGERSRIAFPVGEIEFIADHDADASLPAYQYCPLFAPPDCFTSQDEARAAAEAAVAVLFAVQEKAESARAGEPPAPETPAPNRRAFLRRLGGRREAD